MVRFISEPIQVSFGKLPDLEKKPTAPTGFTWRGEEYTITAVLSEWVDYSRRGRMANNMQPAHLQAAQKKGSWGVGQFYYRVLTATGKIFDLYYDRAPKSASDRKGEWFLDREVAIKE